MNFDLRLGTDIRTPPHLTAPAEPPTPNQKALLPAIPPRLLRTLPSQQ